MPSLKHFKNKEPTHRRKKEPIVLLIGGLFAFSTIFYITYIINSPSNLSELDTININCDKDLLSNEYYINCTFELKSKDDTENVQPLESKIRIRGSGNQKGVLRWPKKGYRIELSQQKSLLGMRKDDDWDLFALYTDYPRMRIKLSMDIWRSLEPTNPTAIFSKSKYIVLYLNGEFQGLYLLAEKNDRRLFGLENAQDDITSSLIIQAKNYAFFTEYASTEWEQDWPNIKEGIDIKDEIMLDLIDFINNSNDDLFFDLEEGIYSKFYKRNLIDFYVYNFFILHEDFWYKNFYIVRNTYPSKFFLVPLDFDHALGQYMDRIYYYNQNPETDIKQKNLLYRRLLSNEPFRQACKTRWFELREELWTEEFFLDMLQENYEEIEDVSEIDTSIWNPYYIKESWENNFEEFVELLYEWIPDRIEFCDLYFAQF